LSASSCLVGYAGRALAAAIFPDVAAERVSREPIVIRPLAPRDSFEALTALLHRAYAPLGALGLNYTALDQSVETTRRRCTQGECFVAADGAQIVGTVTVAGPHDPQEQRWVLQSPWLWRTDAAHLNQLAVDPALQRHGIGRRLVQQCIDWARQRGYRYLALDTAAPANDLRRYYAALGFRDADDVQWTGKRYRSVIAVLPLDGAPWPARFDPVSAVHALWARTQQRDWIGVRALFDESASAIWWTSGERFLDREAIARVNALYPEGWTIEVVEVNALADGRVHSVVRVDHPPHVFYANSLYRFDSERIAAVDEYWATREAPPSWRSAQALGAYERLR
jgi:GNAT superfamily N-acetyltransferase